MISGLADRKGLYQLKQLKSYMKLKLHFRIYIYLFCVDFIDMNSTTTTKKKIIQLYQTLTSKPVFRPMIQERGRKGNGNITELICFLTYSVKLENQSLNIN